MALSTTTLADRLWPLLQDRLFRTPSEAGAFNPWLDRDPELDVEGAPLLRRQNLRNYLERFPASPPVVLVGEAPSWRGCRFSGIAFTAEALLLDPEFPVGGSRTSAFRPKPLTEQSASIVWGCLADHFPAFLLWNAFPFHPHPPEARLGNRTPRRSEVEGHGELLRALLDELDPDEVLAVGRTGERALREIDVACRYVRHPAHGGAKRFRKGVLEVIG